MNKLVKLFLFSFVLVFLTFSLSKPVKALDNDDENFGICDITIGNTSLVPGTTAEIYPDRKEGRDGIFVMTVCGSVLNEIHGDQEDTPVNCMDGGDGTGSSGSELKVSARLGGIFGWSGDFSLDDYSIPGCYRGEIRANPGSVALAGENLDVELDNDDDFSCRKQMPVCQRVKAIFNFDVADEDVAACTEFVNEQSRCDWINISADENGNVVLGDDVIISGTIDSRTQSAECGFDDVNEIGLLVRDPQNDRVIDTHDDYSAGQNFSETFTADRLGIYTIRYRAREYFDLNRYNTSGVYIEPINETAVECTGTFRVCSPNNEGCESETEFETPDTDTTGSTPDPYTVCEANLKEGSIALENCATCAPEGIWTAVGCIEKSPTAMVSKIIKIGVGILGGIFLLRVLSAAFMLTTSQGDVKKTSEAKQMITEAVIGVIFVLFSVTILQFIGSDVLQIPGFGTSP